MDPHLPVEADRGFFPNPDPTDPNKMLMPFLTMPIRPNFIPYDDTDVPGPWFPRNPLWDPGIVDSTATKMVATQTVSASSGGGSDPDAIAAVTTVLDQIQTITITDDLKTKLLQQMPMGLWDTSKPNCTFTGDRKVSDFQGVDRPDWMTVANAPPSAPVYMDTPGGAVFKTICYRCHGLLADSKGLLADAISTLTGGDARVADFRDGLFGPVSAPGTNRARVFGDYLTQHSTSSSLKGITSDDIAVRYIAYMALGGTQKHLPTEVLNEVMQTPVFGRIRNHLNLTGTANMLQLGAALCSQIVGASTDFAPLPVGDLANGRIHWSEHTGLIDASGDVDLWLKLCSLNNRPVVHVVAPGTTWRKDGELVSTGSLTFDGHSEYWGQAADGKLLYPADAPVRDHHGRIHQGITADNPFPICAKSRTIPPSCKMRTPFSSPWPSAVLAAR